MLRAIRAEKARRAEQAERERVSRDAERIRRRCERLVGFVREAWHVLEPTHPYIDGWHIRAICEHLEAITRGTFLAKGLSNRLLINVPPGTMKSLLASVFWPAWEWGPAGMPGMRYLTTSHNEGYVKRDSRRMRDLVVSDWYRSLWPEVELVRSGEASFANSRTGFREGVPFSSLTGGRGDRVIIDDPHSTETAESPAERQRTTRIFRESVPSRVNDPERSAIVVIMQRLHEDDVSGQIVKLGLGYQHLMLPMEFEPERRCRTDLGFEDPRAYEGELLFPDRFTPAVLERDKKPLTAYAIAGQYQQRPAPREGGLFKRQWFEGKFLRQAPSGIRWVRHWDLAATKKATAARTAGVKLGKAPDGSYVVGHVVTTQDEGNRVRSLIKATAEMDGRDVEISLPQDPGQAGKVQAQDFVSMLAGWRVKAEPETGDKITRAEPFSSQCEAGNVWIVEGAWNEAYLDELCLAKGTKISTIGGDVLIENVRCGELVLTREGWRRVTKACCTNPRAELWELQISNGVRLQATQNHPIFVPGSGFKKVGQLQVGDALLRSTVAAPSTSIPNLGSGTSPDELAASPSNCITSSGSKKSARCRQASMFTILTKILRTTYWRIWSASRLRSIFIGIDLGMRSASLASKLASFAEADTRAHSMVDLGRARKSAQTNSNTRRATSTSTLVDVPSVGESSQALTSHSGFAASGAARRPIGEKTDGNPSAASSAGPTSRRHEPNNDFVADLAVSGIRMLLGEHPVFNLEVEGVHEYVANGILVHNCLFPGGSFKDQVDASSGAFGRLAKRGFRYGMLEVVD